MTYLRRTTALPQPSASIGSLRHRQPSLSPSAAIVIAIGSHRHRHWPSAAGPTGKRRGPHTLIDRQTHTRRGGGKRRPNCVWASAEVGVVCRVKVQRRLHFINLSERHGSERGGCGSLVTRAERELERTSIHASEHTAPGPKVGSAGIDTRQDTDHCGTELGNASVKRKPSKTIKQTPTFAMQLSNTFHEHLGSTVFVVPASSNF